MVDLIRFFVFSGQFIFEKCAEQEDTSNFFICYDSRSLIYDQMKIYVENLKASSNVENVHCYNLPDLKGDFLEPT